MRPRVLVIDDSAVARAVLERVLSAGGLVDVVSTAPGADGGLGRISALDPDVVTLDLTMPETDGLVVLQALRGRSRPRVIVVVSSGLDTELVAEALSLGAIDLVIKPTAFASDPRSDLGRELVAKVLAAAGGDDASAPAVGPVARPHASGPRVALIVIGTSTGGPRALALVLGGLPATLAAPIAIALHIPAAYTAALAMRLDAGSPLDVTEAEDGMVLRPGLAVVARGGQHLIIAREGRVLRARLSAVPVRAFAPSVDELFSSAAAAVGAAALGVVLTGMGDDGLAGARVLAAVGAALLTQSARSCTVYGMPRSVDAAGLGARSIPLERMAAEIIRRV